MKFDLLIVRRLVAVVIQKRNGRRIFGWRLPARYPASPKISPITVRRSMAVSWIPYCPLYIDKVLIDRYCSRKFNRRFVCEFSISLNITFDEIKNIIGHFFLLDWILNMKILLYLVPVTCGPFRPWSKSGCKALVVCPIYAWYFCAKIV